MMVALLDCLRERI